MASLPAGSYDREFSVSGPDSDDLHLKIPVSHKKRDIHVYCIVIFTVN